jgi:tetratricopeptide (TPR) repeat protein
MAFMQHHSTRPLQMRVRFGRWDDILRAPAPAEEFAHARAMWHYARGRALVATGRSDEAGTELARVRTAVADPRLAGTRLEFNESPAVLRIAQEVLAGVIAEARGRHDSAVAHLQAAARLEDALAYGEPPDWSVPVRHDLGAALLAAGRPADAERAYREDLKRFPDNVWSLTGLSAALRAQKRDAEAADVAAAARRAAASGDVVPTSSRS